MSSTDHSLASFKLFNPKYRFYRSLFKPCVNDLLHGLGDRGPVLELMDPTIHHVANLTRNDIESSKVF